MFHLPRKTALLCGLLLSSATAFAQMALVKSGKPAARIVCADASETNREAANLLNLFVNRMADTELPLQATAKKGSGNVFIGQATGEVGRDGFVLQCKDGNLHILTGGGKGAIYGVATLLERYLGVNYYAKDCYTLTRRSTVELPALRDAETPAFRYRQTQSYGTEDPVYYNWFRLNQPEEVFAKTMWVHTFDRLLPSDVYGKAHPEYYSFINGKRRPGNHSQWCLTNDEVFEIVAQRVDSIFKAHPEKSLISISQNDGNNTQCACPKCRAVDEYEGSPSGNIIRFLNKLAKRFPDKEFSTLAYLYSMHPPKHTKPLPNVNIMLCDIDCMREVPLTENASGRDFMKALEGWSKISNNIFVWDYGINFDNYLAPFPNFHILQKNIRTFKKHHATMLFEQIGGAKGTDFTELRAYMMAKLMWNPEQDADSLMHAFLDGYYGKAAPYMYQYLKIREGALLASDTPLWIYDSPISHKNGMLKPYLRQTYNELFDRAEEAVKDNPLMLEHVHIARLPLQYSDLEIARTETGGDRESLLKAVTLLKERAAKYGVKHYNERNNTPEEYCNLYLQRFMPGSEPNKALGAKIIWNKPPADRYKQLAEKGLTDGLYGGTTYVESWVGWEGKDADFVIDMGEEKTFTSIESDFLHQLGAWVLLPVDVAYSASSDNKAYRELGSCHFDEDRSPSVKFKTAKYSAPQPVKARYIRVQIKGLGTCPTWHYGVGYPAWFFLDEVMVR